MLVHTHRQVEAAAAIAREIHSLGRKSTVLPADLAEGDALDQFAATAWQWQSRIDIWVNNAGVDVLTGAAARWTFEQKLLALWRVDVLAAIRLSRLIGERMKIQQRGVILNMGWDQAEHGMAGDSGEMFGATKGAVMAFTKSLAQSLAPAVRVNCLAPGWIRTAWGEHASDDWQQRAQRQSLRGRWGSPQDVARAAAFLASPAADFINGQIIPINGGFRFDIA